MGGAALARSRRADRTAYGERWRDFEPLDAIEKSDVIRAAIGYALAEDALGLARFREKYAAKMAGEADRAAFDMASSRLGANSADFGEIAKMAASVDTLDGFLREMKARFPDAIAQGRSCRRTCTTSPIRAPTGALPAIVGTDGALRRGARSSSRLPAVALHQAAGDQAQPSTSTKKISLNGSDTTTGGSIIMPIDISTEATTRSMMRNGRNSRKPISKARFSSEIMKAGTRMRSDISLGRRRRRLAGQIVEQLEVLLADILQHEAVQRHRRALERLLDADLVGDQRLDADVVGALQRRPHHEGGEEQRQRDDHGVGRRGRGAERGAQQRQHHDDAGERRHHHQDRRRQRQHRQQRDQLDRALGEAAVPWPKLMLMSCACAGSTSDPAATSDDVQRRKRYAEVVADLTKASSDCSSRLAISSSRLSKSACRRWRRDRRRCRRGARGHARRGVAATARRSGATGGAPTRSVGSTGAASRRAAVWRSPGRRKRGFEPLRHLGEVLVGGRHRGSAGAAAAWRRAAARAGARGGA